MNTTQFAEIEAEFLKRVTSIIWCNVATIDTQQRPRSRIMHPIWEGQIGWIGTRRESHKSLHLAEHPYVSLAYLGDYARPVYVDCQVEWIDDLTEKQRVWELFKSTPEPVGYDPTPMFKTVESFGLLKLTPWRIDLYEFPRQFPVWRREMQ
jgi:general stress protein 26